LKLFGPLTKQSFTIIFALYVALIKWQQSCPHLVYLCNIFVWTASGTHTHTHTRVYFVK